MPLHDLRLALSVLQDYLLFDSIASVTYSFQMDQDDTFVRHQSRRPVGLTVEVVTDTPVNATVFDGDFYCRRTSFPPRRFISVDQSKPSHPVKTTPPGQLSFHKRH